MAKTKTLLLLLMLLAVSGCIPDSNVAYIASEEAYPALIEETGYPIFAKRDGSVQPTAPTRLPQFSPTPTLTHTPIPPFLTNNTVTPYPTVVPMLTPGSDRSPDLMLPGNLQLEEFPMREGDSTYEIWEQILARHPERGEHLFVPYNSDQRWVDGPVTLEHVFGPHSKLLVKWEGRSDFEITCSEPLIYPFHGFTYTGEHWYLGSWCPDDVSVFMDGVSLNEERGYDQSIGFQIMDGQPLYLYQKDNTVGISYGWTDTALPYDRLVYAHCEGCYPPPNNFERMITFAAFAGEQLYYVAIGQFEN